MQGFFLANSLPFPHLVSFPRVCVLQNTMPHSPCTAGRTVSVCSPTMPLSLLSVPQSQNSCSVQLLAVMSRARGVWFKRVVGVFYAHAHTKTLSVRAGPLALLFPSHSRSKLFYMGGRHPTRKGAVRLGGDMSFGWNPLVKTHNKNIAFYLHVL